MKKSPKFYVGQQVRLKAFPVWDLVILSFKEVADGGFKYHAVSLNEAFQSVAKEDELEENL